MINKNSRNDKSIWLLLQEIMTGKMRTVICLLRNDLRIHDNEALLWAHRNGDFVVPLYCFDPDHFKGTWNFHFSKTASYRARFMVESILDLRDNLRKCNSDLLVENSRPIDSIKKIIKACFENSKPVVNVVYQKEVTHEELIVEKDIKNFCESKGINVFEIWGSTLYHKDDIPYKINGAIGNLPNTYTEFRKGTESKANIRPILTMPDQLKPFPPELPIFDVATLSELGLKEVVKDPRSAFPFPGGETSGLDRLQEYLFRTHRVSKYKETRNGMVGESYSTKFSVWLAHGCLSPRMIFSEIKRYEKIEGGNQSTYWVIFELLWRDYFKFVCMKFGDRVFYETGILDKKIPWSQDMKKFEAWSEGRTGVPFVDANMRELKHTGFMSNRGRQNVASFLVKDLGLDWRLGAEWFESLLLDHDVCSNYGNWNYAAGIGNDPRENRKFNMIKQGMDYDGDGEFVRLWVEELRGIEGSKVHYPWAVSSHELGNVKIGETYPEPMIVQPEWTRHYGKDKAREKRVPKREKDQPGIQSFFKSTERGKANKRRGGRVQDARWGPPSGPSS